jgi:hypothetical protein
MVVVSKVVDIVEVRGEVFVGGICGGIWAGCLRCSRIVLLKKYLTAMKLWERVSVFGCGMRRLQILYIHRPRTRVRFDGGTILSFPSSDNVKQLKNATSYVQIFTHSAICLKDEDYDIRSEQERRRVGTI